MFILFPLMWTERPALPSQMLAEASIALTFNLDETRAASWFDKKCFYKAMLIGINCFLYL